MQTALSATFFTICPFDIAFFIFDQPGIGSYHSQYQLFDHCFLHISGLPLLSAGSTFNINYALYLTDLFYNTVQFFRTVYIKSHGYRRTPLFAGPAVDRCQINLALCKDL